MNKRALSCIAVLAAFGAALIVPRSGWAEIKPSELERQIFPLSPVNAIPEVKLDLPEDASPEVKAWAERSAQLVRDWWPVVSRMLATEKFTPPKEFTVSFRNDPGKPPGYRTNEGLFISIPWITRQPDDFGMIIHEMTHAIQDYRRVRGAGWLVEGIADYIRYWRYEPEKPKRRIDPKKATYRDGYVSTPSFLAWLIWKYDRRIVHDFDAALRDGSYQDELFQKLTGKPVEELWKEFLGELPWCGVSPS